VSNARFDYLVGRLLDDEPTSDEWSELLGLVRDDPALLEQLRDQLEASELLALSEDPVRGSPLFLEATCSRLADARFVSGVRAALEGRSPGRRRGRAPGWLGVVAASAAATLLTTVVLWPRAKPEIARVTGLNGSLQWIGDGGRLESDLKVGTVLGGGTVEALGANSWMSLEFGDGTTATVSGPAMLTLAEGDQKQLHLREGSLFAKVARQAQGRPMLIHTRMAELEILGTQLDVEAEPGATRLNVDEGRVRVTRLVDGSVALVPARHQVVATADRTGALTPMPRAEAVNWWKSRLTASIGKPLPPQGDLPDRLRAMPIILSRPKQGTFAVFVAGFGVAQAEAPPVRLEAGSQFRIRGRLGTAHHLGFGVTMKRSGGSFGGKFETIVPAQRFATKDGRFDLTVDPAILKPLQPGASGTPVGSEVEDCYVFTVNVDAGLEVAEVELMPPTSPVRRP
jgi:ferric-dicitrate binding protein FerR (iron transport regulator)